MHFRRLWVFLGIIYIGFILVGSLLKAPDINQHFNHTDKIIHFLMYFILVGWFIQLYHRFPSRTLILSGAILFGLLIEFLQDMTPYRSFEYADAVANTLGASCAFLLSHTPFNSILMHIDSWLFLKFNYQD